jgi:predicted enzyme related to lactoylglutathione lyase
MALDLFAGIPVNDYAAALVWYQQLFGSPPTFFASDTEAVWELAEHRWVFIVQRAEHAGHAMHTILVDDLDARVAQIADRGLEPTKRETYENGMRKTTYCDADGNEFGFGGAPL